MELVAADTGITPTGVLQKQQKKSYILKEADIKKNKRVMVINSTQVLNHPCPYHHTATIPIPTMPNNKYV